MITLQSQIEGILFVRTEGVKVSLLCKLLSAQEEDIRSALTGLKGSLEGRGIQLLFSGDTAMLTTHAELSDIVGDLFEEDTKTELTPASLQTLSIILYKGTASRGEISYIRGVDSRMSLRNLSIRGLIERVGTDTYRATTDTLRFLGVGSVEELPRFADIKESLAREISTSQ
jgi:segregation and condensation protein B